MIERLTQLFKYRALIQILILRELKARYRGTALGFLWSFVNPLILMVIYVLIFSIYMRIDMKNYGVFLLCGILPWAWFSSGLNEATLSIISNGGLIKKISSIRDLSVRVYRLKHGSLSSEHTDSVFVSCLFWNRTIMADPVFPRDSMSPIHIHLQPGSHPVLAGGSVP